MARYDVYSPIGVQLGVLEYELDDPPTRRLVFPVQGATGKMSVVLLVHPVDDRIVLMTSKYPDLDTLRQLPGWTDS